MRRVRGIEVCDGEGAEHRGGALSAAGDGALGGAIAEIDVDDTHGPEGAQCFGGGEVEACGLEFFLDGTMEQEGERGDENVSLHALVGLMIDRPGVEDRESCAEQSRRHRRERRADHPLRELARLEEQTLRKSVSPEPGRNEIWITISNISMPHQLTLGFGPSKSVWSDLKRFRVYREQVARMKRTKR